MYATSDFEYSTCILEEIDSTNAYAQRIVDKVRDPLWIMARRQTAAKGRRGRAWRNPDGNFAASLIFFPDQSPEKMALRSFVAALAVFEACVMVTGREEIFSIKWPNDVMARECKVSGILLETCQNAKGQTALVVGIGVNLMQAPKLEHLEAQALKPTSLFSETGLQVKQDDFLDALADCFAKYESQFITHGFGPVQTAWLQHAARLGQTITARLSDESLTGRFDTIDENGHLVMTTVNGSRKISSADVFF